MNYPPNLGETLITASATWAIVLGVITFGAALCSCSGQIHVETRPAGAAAEAPVESWECVEQKITPSLRTGPVTDLRAYRCRTQHGTVCYVTAPYGGISCVMPTGNLNANP